MSTAQFDFLDRVNAISVSIEKPTLIDNGLGDSQHNITARILRNGLSVMLFVSLEDFIKKRTNEYLSDISTCGITFADLPVSIQYDFTVGVLEAVNKQIKKKTTKQEKITFIQDESKCIESTISTNLILSEYTYGYKSSNINKEEIGSILKSFQVANPWKQITSIAKTANLTAIDLSILYENLSDNRHNAAHDANYNTTTTSLEEGLENCKSIALSFDSLMKCAVRNLTNKNARYLKGAKVRSDDISISYIQRCANRWAYNRRNSQRNSRVNKDRSQLISDALPIAKRNKELLLILNDYNKVEKWFVC